jgi:hypothetical protein
LRGNRRGAGAGQRGRTGGTLRTAPAIGAATRRYGLGGERGD